MFWTFNLRFEILATVLATFPNIGPLFVQFSGHSGILQSVNTEGGSITVQLTSCLTCLDQSVLQIKTIVNCHTADSKTVKREVNSTMILPPLVFPAPIFLRVYYYMGALA
jgi:hypothetical protein